MNRLKLLREEKKLLQEDLGKIIGVSKSAIGFYENEKRDMSPETIIKLANFFNVSTDFLLGKSDIRDYNKALEQLHKESEKELMQNGFYIKDFDPNKIQTTQNNIDINADRRIYACPVYGRISAGQPNWAEECIEGRLPIDPNLMGIIDPEECYFLRVNGESMNKVIDNGAYALIRKTDWVENGEIAVVLVNGFDATLKKFSKQGDLVVLEPMSNDNSFQVQIYDKNTPVEVIGKYIGKFEMKQ